MSLGCVAPVTRQAVVLLNEMDRTGGETDLGGIMSSVWDTGGLMDKERWSWAGDAKGGAISMKPVFKLGRMSVEKRRGKLKAPPQEAPTIRAVEEREGPVGREQWPAVQGRRASVVPQTSGDRCVPRRGARLAVPGAARG